MAIDFKPTRGNYTDLTPFRFWCQKVLPLVYDESLSYYELLCKVVDYLNKTMEDVGVLNDDIEALYDAFDKLQTYVDNYFTNLDVQEEINNKLDAMAVDGTLTELVAPIARTTTAAWLQQYLSPETGYVLDNSLTVENAAAGAKATGDAIRTVNNAFQFFENNIENNEIVLPDPIQFDGYNQYLINIPAGKYTLCMNIGSTPEAFSDNFHVRFTSGTQYNSGTVYDYIGLHNHDHGFIVEFSEDVHALFIFSKETSSASAGRTLNINTFHLYYGEFVPANNFDVSNIVSTILNAHKKCALEDGIYTVKNPIMMPNNAELCGQGANSVLRYDPNSEIHFQIENKSNETYFNISGAGEETNTHIIYQKIFTPGLYRIKGKINLSATTGYIRFLRTFAYGSANIIEVINYTNGVEFENYVFLNETALSIFVYGGGSSSLPVNVEYLTIDKLDAVVCVSSDNTLKDLAFEGSSSEITISSDIGNANGILYTGSVNKASVIENVKFRHFNGSGVMGYETTGYANSGLQIADCFFENNNIGIFIKSHSEYWKVSNSILYNNYYGVLSRGGNNIFSNCGLDKNIIGIQIDVDEGSNAGHGSFTGCTINHSGANNDGIGLLIKDTGRMNISNCQFHYSDIQLINTNGNIIAACQMGNDSLITVSGGSCNIISDCMMRTRAETITITGNTQTKVHDCYTRDGYIVDPVIN